MRKSFYISQISEDVVLQNARGHAGSNRYEYTQAGAGEGEHYTTRTCATRQSVLGYEYCYMMSMGLPRTLICNSVLNYNLLEVKRSWSVETSEILPRSDFMKFTEVRLPRPSSEFLLAASRSVPEPSLLSLDHHHAPRTRFVTLRRPSLSL